jgi:hypothetical protein
MALPMLVLVAILSVFGGTPNAAPAAAAPLATAASGDVGSGFPTSSAPVDDVGSGFPTHH